MGMNRSCLSWLDCRLQNANVLVLHQPPVIVRRRYQCIEMRRIHWMYSRNECCLPAVRIRSEQSYSFLAGGIQINMVLHDYLRGDSLLLRNQAEQQVLRADICMLEPGCFVHRELENFFRTRCVGQIGTRGAACLPHLDHTLNLLCHRGWLGAEVLEDSCCYAFAL